MILDFSFIHHKWNQHPISTPQFWNVQVLCGELVSENENYVWHALANAASAPRQSDFDLDFVGQ